MLQRPGDQALEILRFQSDRFRRQTFRQHRPDFRLHTFEVNIRQRHPIQTCFPPFKRRLHFPGVFIVPTVMQTAALSLAPIRVFGDHVFNRRVALQQPDGRRFFFAGSNCASVGFNTVGMLFCFRFTRPALALDTLARGVAVRIEPNAVRFALAIFLAECMSHYSALLPQIAFTFCACRFWKCSRIAPTNQTLHPANLTGGGSSPRRHMRSMDRLLRSISFPN